MQVCYIVFMYSVVQMHLVGMQGSQLAAAWYAGLHA